MGRPADKVALPEGASIHVPHWSNDGTKIAFAVDLDDRVELWIADAATGQAKPVPGARLNDVMVPGLPGFLITGTCWPHSCRRDAGRRRSRHERRLVPTSRKAPAA